jgi:hypothetical protein
MGYRIDFSWFRGFGFGIWWNDLWGAESHPLWTLSVGPLTIHWWRIKRRIV